MNLRVRLLGPVELCRDGRPITAGGPTQRAVLAMLVERWLSELLGASHAKPPRIERGR